MNLKVQMIYNKRYCWHITEKTISKLKIEHDVHVCFNESKHVLFISLNFRLQFGSVSKSKIVIQLICIAHALKRCNVDTDPLWTFWPNANLKTLIHQIFILTGLADHYQSSTQRVQFFPASWQGLQHILKYIHKLV